MPGVDAVGGRPRRGRSSWPTKSELRTDDFDYIEALYNRRRRHRSLGMLSPAQYETITHHHHLEQLQTA